MQARQVSEILGISIDRNIKGIVEDIRYVEEDYLFIVRKGRNYDVFKDIDEALLKGAIVLHENLQEKRGQFIYNLKHRVHLLLEAFYKNIYTYFKIVGVCGTNGKSSVVMYLYEMMKEYRCMKIGTHFIESCAFEWENNNTTPSEITLLHMLHLAKKHHIEYIFMEVSSHAIDEKRVSLLRFDAIIYTNIDRDHLDYHKTLLHYHQTKFKLMNYLKKNGFVIANCDESYFSKLKKVCKHPLITYGQKAAHFQIADINLSYQRSSFCINRFYFHMHLLSMMNVYNVSACISLLRMWQISYYTLYKKVLNLNSMAGRLEVVYDRDFTVIVDYAHTSKAFYEVLHFLSSMKKNRLIVVVGCGGEREKQKRSEIGYYASHYCDICIFSEDNSRYESVDMIMKDMSLRVKEKAIMIREREKAIEYAIKIATNDDIILVSGKGDEQFLSRNGEKIPFNDKSKILELLE